MAKVVEIANIGNVEFPDTMSDADITKAIETDILPNQRETVPLGSSSGASLPFSGNGFDINKHPELQGMAFPSILGSAAHASMIGQGAKGITLGAEDLLAKGMNAIVDNRVTQAIANPVVNFLSKLGGSGRVADLAGGEDVAKVFATPQAQEMRQKMAQQGVGGDVSQILPRTLEGSPTVEVVKARESINKLHGMEETAKRAELIRSRSLADSYENLSKLTDEVGGKTTQEAGQAFNELRQKHGSWTNPDKVAAANEKIQAGIAEKTIPMVDNLRELTSAFDEMVAVKAPEEAKAILKNLSFKQQKAIEDVINKESARLMPDAPVVQSNNARSWLVDRLSELKNKQSPTRDQIAQIKFLANKLSDFRKVPNTDVADWLDTMQGIGKESFGGKIPYSLYADLRKAMLKDASESSKYYRSRGFSVGDIGLETDAAIGGYRDSFKRAAMEDLVAESSVKDAAGNPQMKTLDAKAFRSNLKKNKEDFESMFSPAVIKKLDDAAEVAERIQEIPTALKPQMIRMGEFATSAGQYRAATGTIARMWDSINAEARLKIMTTKEGQDRLLKVGEALRKKDAASINREAVGLQKWLEGYMGARAIKAGLENFGKSLPPQPQQQPTPKPPPISMFGRPQVRVQ